MTADWGPVSLKISRRAKRVTLKLSVRGGITVVAPRYFRKSQLPALLEEHKDWLTQTRNRMLSELKSNDGTPLGQAPRKIELRAIREEWAVRYRPSFDGKLSVGSIYPGCLLVTARREDVSDCEAALRAWLRERAKRRLPPWLDRISEEFGLPYKRATIRNQRSRWGSCSRQKSISLNQKLMFFPPRLVRYLMIHELCHTIHLNHSSRFWHLVEQCDPLYKKHERELRSAWRYVPLWCDPE